MSTLAAKLWIDFNSFIVECKADPIGVFRSLSKKTQITIISTTAIASTIMSIALKRKFIRYQMRKLGYRQLDQISYVNQLMQDHNFPITIFGFELADSQRMTLTDTQFFASNIIKYFINFRSEIVNKNGIYYYKETVNTDNFNINQFVTYIEMEINDNIQSDIDEFIIQHAVKYVNKQNLINVKWNEYTNGPNWDIFYLHYKKYNKCFLFFRCNHVLIDGLFASTCICFLQFQLWNKNSNLSESNNMKLDFKNIKQNMHKFYGQPPMKKPWWYNIYMTYTLIPSFIGVLISAIGLTADPICSVNGGEDSWNGQYKWALSAPIKINEFKSVSNNQCGTVNDFFLLLCSKSIYKYMNSRNDNINITELNGVGVKSQRNLLNIDNEFMEYCINGMNANKLMYIPYRIPVHKGSNIKLIQSRFAKVKYGLTAWWSSLCVNLLVTMPFMMQHWVKTSGGASTFVSSNLIGPKMPLPLPSRKGGKYANGDEYVKWSFGMSTPASANMNFSILTYNGYVRLGITSEIGSVDDPQLLVNYFMDEYKQYLK